MRVAFVNSRVLGIKMKSDDTDPPDSLVRAIGEFREDLLRWIDTELAWLRVRERAESRVMEEESTGPTSNPSGLRVRSQLDSRTSRDAACTSRPDRATLEAVPEIARPHGASSGAETDPKPQAPPLSPSQRLDAPARVLDHRLKQAQGAAGSSRGATSEGKTG